MSTNEVNNSVIKLRENPIRRKDKVYIGCGAGFSGDRPIAALKLLQRAEELEYLVLECLAERTLADRYQIFMSGGKGYDPRIKEWMSLLLPLAVEKDVCIITNMGAVDPHGAQKEVLEVACDLGLELNVATVIEIAQNDQGGTSLPFCTASGVLEGRSTYLGAAPIVHCLEKYKPQVVITSRVADAALFLAPMVHELGWNWDSYEELAQGLLAGHLLECACQLTGGYFTHPGDASRNFSSEQLLALSLPYAEISYKGEVSVMKAEGSGGLLNFATCAEQLLYEVGDPGNYITPDMVVDFRNVEFSQISNDKVLCRGARPSNIYVPDKLLQLVPVNCGWKGWGEISYGGHSCLERAQVAEFLVRSWISEAYPCTKDKIFSYAIGYDSLKIRSNNEHIFDIRLRMDGLFECEEHATQFVKEFTALYTNGPAGGGGISTGLKKEILLEKKLVERGSTFWVAGMEQTNLSSMHNKVLTKDASGYRETLQQCKIPKQLAGFCSPLAPIAAAAAPVGEKILLYQVAHSRAGDKGNDINFSLIPHFPGDVHLLRKIITPDWVKAAVAPLLNPSSFPDNNTVKQNNLPEHVTVEIYDVPGISSLNVVVRNILDGGVNCSRRIDRHGKTISDLILSQELTLPS